MTVLFRADFQNTLTPEVGTYDNTSEKTGSFGLDGGEYYLQNSNNTKGYYFYYLASGSDNSKLTITFDIAILNSSSSGWSVLFSGSNSNWWGLFTSGNSFSLNTKSGADTSLGSYSTSTWYTVKITQEVSLGVLNIKLYIDDVEKADISRDASYAITNLLLLGNTSTSWAAYGTVLKNVLITDGEEEEPTPSGILKYLNLTGLSNLVTNIKNWVTARIPTKTSEITNDSGFITSSSLPTVNDATLTIQKNGTNVQTFTANASSNVTCNITVPTAVSELTNDSGFLTSHQSLSNYSTLANTVKSLSISGKTITVTPGSGSAYTLTTQDTVYTHPTSAGNKHIPSGGSSGQILKYSSSGTAVWADVNFARTFNNIASRTSTGTWTISGVTANTIIYVVGNIVSSALVNTTAIVNFTSGIASDSTWGTSSHSVANGSQSTTWYFFIAAFATATSVKVSISHTGATISSVSLKAYQ